jgi:hypothetical protein
MTNKSLSYSIRLNQPSFPIADQTRCLKSKSMLGPTVEDAKKCKSKLRKYQDKLIALNEEIPQIEQKVKDLQVESRAPLNMTRRTHTHTHTHTHNFHTHTQFSHTQMHNIPPLFLPYLFVTYSKEKMIMFNTK